MLDREPHIAVQEAEYTRLLGYPRRHTLTGRARELADWARDWYAEHGDPWIYTRRTEALCVMDEGFSIEGISFKAARLRQQLADAEAHAVVLVAVSAGAACEEEARQRWLEEKPDEYFFLEVYGSAVVEHLVTTAGARLCASADEQGMAVLPHYSPGYPGWDVVDQTRLLPLIQRQNGEAMPNALHVLETGMLRPKKSMLAVFGLTAHVDRVERLTELVPCARCPMQACRYRRTPYKYARAPIEDVRTLQATAPENTSGHTRKGTPLTQNAAYSVSTKALRKWSRERLQLTVREDRRVEARFLYEGTTCSNLGRSLAFDYRIILAAPDQGYRILEASCTPAPGNDGYTAMCKYRKDPEALMDAIGAEKPFVGQPLDAVLTWERRFSPTGCYCDAASRTHKWGLALEVVHYTLAQAEKERLSQPTENNTVEF